MKNIGRSPWNHISIYIYKQQSRYLCSTRQEKIRYLCSTQRSFEAATLWYGTRTSGISAVPILLHLFLPPVPVCAGQSVSLLFRSSKTLSLLIEIPLLGIADSAWAPVWLCWALNPSIRDRRLPCHSVAASALACCFPDPQYLYPNPLRNGERFGAMIGVSQANGRYYTWLFDITKNDCIKVSWLIYVDFIDA